MIREMLSELGTLEAVGSIRRHIVEGLYTGFLSLARVEPVTD